MSKILVIDDDATLGLMLKSFLTKQGYMVQTASSARQGYKCYKESTFDLVLIDYRLPDQTGLEFLQTLREEGTTTPVVLMTSYTDIRTAVKAIKMGAFEYVAKPLNPDELVLIIQRALQKPEQATTPTHAPGKARADFLIGVSDDAVRVHEYITLVAPTDMSVIIEGESGTGKENASRLIHDNSRRSHGPFVALDCGALSKELAASELFGHVKGAFTGATSDKEGQFERAHGGTLFLDEVGNLSYDIQVQLLRAIQERTIRRVGGNKDISVDVRLVTATNEDLIESVRNGQFREDLYHRLNEFKINLSPLRKRKKDIVLFAEFFLKKANAELGKSIKGYSEEVMVALLSYSWPGNLREFKNVVKRAVLLSKTDQIELACLPSEIAYHQFLEDEPEPAPVQITAGGHALKTSAGPGEKELIITTLESVRYNKSKAARLLNIDRKTLYNKLKQYNINL
jgi:two-component system, NtrC family, response regulator HydG